LSFFKHILKEIEALVSKCDALIKATRLLKDIFKEEEVFFLNLRLFENIFREIEAF
jgi:hypothetical protein